MFRPRKYQSDVVASWEQLRAQGVKRQLFHLATGLGKTAVVALLRKNYFPAETYRTLIVSHTQELVYQAYDAMISMDPQLKKLKYTSFNRPGAGIVMGDEGMPHARVISASIQTLDAPGRLDEILRFGPIDLLIIDEAHHAVAPTYMHMAEKLREVNPNMDTVGLTATPIRADNLALLHAFDKITCSVGIQWGVAHGWLQPLVGHEVHTLSMEDAPRLANGEIDPAFIEKVMAVDNANEIMLNTWEKEAKGRPTVAFMKSVEDSISFAKYAVERGITCGHIDGELIVDEFARTHIETGTPYRQARRDLLQRFRDGKVQMISNFKAIAEGVDVPGIACVIWMNLTENAGFFTQCVGRGTRLRPGLNRQLFDTDAAEYIFEYKKGGFERVNKEKVEGYTDCLVLDFAATGVPIVTAGTLYGDDLKKPAEMDEVLEDEEEQAEYEELYPSLELDSFFQNTRKEVFNGKGSLIKTRSLFANSDNAWYSHQDGAQSLGLTEDTGLFIHPRRVDIVYAHEQRVTQIMNMLGRDRKGNAPLSDEKREALNERLAAYRAMTNFFGKFSLWVVTGKGMKYAALVDSFDSIEDAVYAAFPIASECSEGFEILNGKGKRWRNMPPTESQLKLLCEPATSFVHKRCRSAGISMPVQFEGELKRGYASSLISHYLMFSTVVKWLRHINDTLSVPEDIYYVANVPVHGSDSDGFSVEQSSQAPV